MLEQELVHIQRRENKAVVFLECPGRSSGSSDHWHKKPKQRCASGVAADLTYLPPHEITMLCCSGYGNCL